MCAAKACGTDQLMIKKAQSTPKRGLSFGSAPRSLSLFCFKISKPINTTGLANSRCNRRPTEAKGGMEQIDRLRRLQIADRDSIENVSCEYFSTIGTIFTADAVGPQFAVSFSLFWRG
jgi:hypothetical protein